MEYAEGGSLKNYLEVNFNNLTWHDKYNLAFQLASAVLCLHKEGIVHRDLHSSNILIHQGVVKLANFGFAKRIEESRYGTYGSKNFGLIPYVDPKRFCGGPKRGGSKFQDVKSDVYSVGVLLWEISSGRPPFYVEGGQDEIYLGIKILQGFRESIIHGTPEDYVKLYTECWDHEPDNRPTMDKVVEELNVIFKKTY
ncbi:2804_t:CDS:2 [Funneliformis geosporum]|nr:2804_t:CDS:2 [Funneliformis geosporum]